MKPMNIHRDILRIAIPAIVSNITVPLLGLIDVAIVGHLGSAAYIGAIAIGGMIFNVIYWIFGFLRMGTSGLTSQSLGGRDLAECVRLFIRSFGIGIAVAAMLMVLQVPIRTLALLVMRPTAEVAALATTYFDICIWGAPAMLGSFAVTGWFIGMQNSRIPMIVAISQNVINIIASLLLVFSFGMKVEGVALGTLIAQYGGLLIAIALGWRHYGRLRVHYTSSRLWERSSMFLFLRVNRDIFLRTLCLVSVMLFFTSAGSWQGEQMLAVNTLLMQLYLFFSYFMDGFAYAGEALCGKWYGARNTAMLNATVRSVFVWGAAMMLLFTLVYAAGGNLFLRMLTDEADVLSLAGGYLFWSVILPVAGMAAFVWDGIFIGITATRSMLISMFAAAASFFAVYHLAMPAMGNHGLWLAFAVFVFMRGAVLTLLYRF